MKINDSEVLCLYTVQVNLSLVFKRNGGSKLVISHFTSDLISTIHI